jgi:Fur family peroxide stress response transcriptional regulator
MWARLRAAGLKMTPQRVAIVRQIAADESHPSAQELFDRLRPTSPSMSFATVYNTLAALCDAGLVASLALAPGSTRFDPNMRPHDHAVCDRCGDVRDVLTAAAPRLRRSSTSDGAPSAMSAIGFEVRSVERIFRGLCLACARGAAPGAAPAPSSPPASARRAATKRGRPGLFRASPVNP